MTEINTKEMKNRAVLVGLNAYSLSRDENATDASMEELSHSERLKLAMKALKKKLTGPQRKQIPMYLALILADAQVDDALQYPPAAQLQESAQQLQQEIAAL